MSLPTASSSHKLLCLLASPRCQGSFCRFQQSRPVSVCCVHWPHQGVRAHFAASSSLIQPQIAVSLGLTKESGLILPLPAASPSHKLLCLLASPRSQGSFCCFHQPHPATNCCVLQFLQRVRTASTGLIESQFALSIGLTKGSCSVCCFHQPHQVSVCCDFVSSGLIKESGLILLLPPSSSNFILLCPCSFCCFHHPHQITFCFVHAHFAASVSLIKSEFAVSIGLTTWSCSVFYLYQPHQVSVCCDFVSIGLAKESMLILLLPPASSNFSSLCPCSFCCLHQLHQICLLCPLASPRSQGSFCCFHLPHQITVCCVHWPHQGVRTASISLIKSEFAVSFSLIEKLELSFAAPILCCYVDGRNRCCQESHHVRFVSPLSPGDYPVYVSVQNQSLASCGCCAQEHGSGKNCPTCFSVRHVPGSDFNPVCAFLAQQNCKKSEVTLSLHRDFISLGVLETS